MRKYIHIARCMKPKLTEEASEVIAAEYSKLRSEESIDSDTARVNNFSYFSYYFSYLMLFLFIILLFNRNFHLFIISLIFYYFILDSTCNSSYFRNANSIIYCTCKSSFIKKCYCRRCTCSDRIGRICLF